MNDYRYNLASNKFPKLNCPFCGAIKHWQRYYDIETGEVLPEKYGLCDNASKCGKGLNPYNDGYNKMIREKEKCHHPDIPRSKQNIINRKVISNQHPVFIPKEVLIQTLEGYEQNVFVQNLLHQVPFPFKNEDVERAIALYYLGTIQNGYRKGSITFPFIDIDSNVRAVQVKLFDENNHTTATDFLHSIIGKHYRKLKGPLPNWLGAYSNQDLKVSCLFGEHLLNKFPLNPVALVEAPKSAIVGTLYFDFPENTNKLLWLAVYNLSSLNFNKCKALKGREIILFPDLSENGRTFELWSQKAKELEKEIPGTKFIVSDLLEKNASKVDKSKGLDLADYIIKLDWREFRNKSLIDQTITDQELLPPLSSENGEKSEIKKEPYFSFIKPANKEKVIKVEKHCEIEKEQSINWNLEIAELEQYFTEIKLPKQPIKLNQCTTISDVSRFIESHLDTLKRNNEKRIFFPCFSRLIAFKKYFMSRVKNY
jgi:Domain of unknown function (DUF6371)/Domain of unknown function (DUF6965)/Zinc beta-ribbon finger, putative